MDHREHPLGRARRQAQRRRGEALGVELDTPGRITGAGHRGGGDAQRDIIAVELGSGRIGHDLMGALCGAPVSAAEAPPPPVATASGRVWSYALLSVALVGAGVTGYFFAEGQSAVSARDQAATRAIWQKQNERALYLQEGCCSMRTPSGSGTSSTRHCSPRSSASAYRSALRRHVADHPIGPLQEHPTSERGLQAREDVEPVEVYRRPCQRGGGLAEGQASLERHGAAGAAVDRDPLTPLERVAISHELEAGLGGVAAVEQPPQIRHGAAQQRRLIGGEQLGIVWVGASVLRGHRVTFDRSRDGCRVSNPA